MGSRRHSTTPNAHEHKTLASPAAAVTSDSSSGQSRRISARSTSGRLVGARLPLDRLFGDQLTSGRLFGVQLTPARPVGVRFANAQLAWPRVSGARLASAPLTPVRLLGAKLAAAAGGLVLACATACSSQSADNAVTNPNPVGSATSPTADSSASGADDAAAAEPPMLEVVPESVPDVPDEALDVPTRGGVVLPATGDGPLAGKRIAVDPGHNGQRHKVLSSQVPAGNGRTKQCNTTGTASHTGLTEHELNWDVGWRLTDQLRAAGAEVILTRPSDDGVGPCVNERAAIPNTHNADLVVSIHADGAPLPTHRGFHIIHSTTMEGGNEVQETSTAAAKTMVEALESNTPIPRSSYVGDGTGRTPRDDIAGMNLLTVPGVMVELGNMHNIDDYNQFSAADGRHTLATALARGVVNHFD